MAGKKMYYLQKKIFFTITDLVKNKLEFNSVITSNVASIGDASVSIVKRCKKGILTVSDMTCVMEEHY